MIFTMSVYLQNLTSIVVIVHCASACVSRLIFDWAHTYNFYVAEDWFGMADLDLQSPVDPSGVVRSYPSPTPFLFCYSFRFFRFLMNSFSFFQTRKFNIKVFVCVNSVLKVRPEIAHEYGYYLQQDGWLDAFTNEKNQTMRSDGIPWRGTRKKHQVFFL